MRELLPQTFRFGARPRQALHELYFSPAEHVPSGYESGIEAGRVEHVVESTIRSVTLAVGPRPAFFEQFDQMGSEAQRRKSPNLTRCIVVRGR